MNLAPTLMLQGTASSVGKTLLVAALCRVFANRGIRVAPFKAQNMALNAHVTPEQLEIGCAQALQARACRVLPHVDMNPILLKPQGDRSAQIVLMGRTAGQSSAIEYHRDKPRLREIVLDALHRLRTRFDMVIIEGAGSPAEINLRDRDLVNMFIAHQANAPVLLVGDIDRGGVFAHLLGTLELLEPADRARVRGLIINQFRGDPALLGTGLTELEQRTGVDVLGVVPHVPDLRLPGEDSLSVSPRVARRSSRFGQHPSATDLVVAIVNYPRASNLDEFDALGWEHRVVARLVDHPAALQDADLVILPGSKATLADLQWMRMQGFDAALKHRTEQGRPTLGICGGCQMLGQSIADPHGVEVDPGTVATGLGLLPASTVFEQAKRTMRVHVRATDHPWLGTIEQALGYWIHAGRLVATSQAAIQARPELGALAWEPDGAHDVAGVVVGTMVHGLLENESVRHALLHRLAQRRGLDWAPVGSVPSPDAELNRLASAVEEALDMEALERLMGHFGSEHLEI